MSVTKKNIHTAISYASGRIRLIGDSPKLTPAQEYAKLEREIEKLSRKQHAILEKQRKALDLKAGDKVRWKGKVWSLRGKATYPHLSLCRPRTLLEQERAEKHGENPHGDFYSNNYLADILKVTRA